MWKFFFKALVPDFVRRFFSALAGWALLALGLVVFVACVATAIYLPDKSFGIVITALGSCFSTILGCLAVPKLGLIHTHPHELEATVSKLKTELAKSNAEAQHLASQKIEVTAFKGIWGLSVLKLDTIIKDFYMQEFNHTEGGV